MYVCPSIPARFGFFPGQAGIEFPSWTLTNQSLFTVVQEVFNNDHRIVSKAGSSSGRFHFVAHEAGDHKICFMPSSTSGRPSWLSTSSPNGGIKLKLDMVIGSSSEIESSDKNTLNDITSRVKDLNNRLNDIRREQIFQRVSAAAKGDVA